MKIEVGLAPKEVLEARKFWESLKPEEVEDVARLMKIVHGVATMYLKSGEAMDVMYQFKKRDDSTTPATIGNPFFNLYAVGGILRFGKEASDIDLMLVTNYRTIDGYLEEYGSPPSPDSIFQSRDGEMLLNSLMDEFHGTHIINKRGELPNNYNLGLTKGKVVIELHPMVKILRGKRKIDLIYVRSMTPKNVPIMSDEYDELTETCFFISEEDFERMDVDRGVPLERVVLYRAKGIFQEPNMPKYTSWGYICF